MNLSDSYIEVIHTWPRCQLEGFMLNETMRNYLIHVIMKKTMRQNEGRTAYSTSRQ